VAPVTAAADWESLLHHQVLFVSGKGGTGKSTVAAAVAVAGATMGRRVLLCEVEGRGEAARTLGVEDPGYREVPTSWGPSVLSISPMEAVFEYLHVYGGLDRISRPMLRSGSVDQLLRWAPGFRDLLACGKVYELAHVRRIDSRDAGRPQYDLVVVDAPPTGQIAGFLSAPETFASMVPMGPVRRRADNTARLLRRRSALVVVAVPEEMAVTETLEAIPAVAPSGVRVAAVVLNRTEPHVASTRRGRGGSQMSRAELTERAERAGLELDEETAAAVVDAGADARRRHATDRRWAGRLSNAASVLTLPEVVGANAVAGLAGAITGRQDRAAPASAVPAASKASPRPPDWRTPEVTTLDAQLDGARIVVVCGSGGVGKTTVSAAIAVHLAAAGRTTLLLTVDPARRLATALRLPLEAGDRTSIPLGGGRRMEAMQLDTKRTFDELVERYGGTRERKDRILSNAFYQRISDTLAGTHEYMAMEKLYELSTDPSTELLVIDTPPTRSALSFLEAPQRMTDFLGGRFVRWMTSSTARAGRIGLSAARLGAAAFLRTVGRLVGAGVIADTIDFLSAFEGMYDGFRDRAAKVEELLRSPACQFVVVASPAAGSLEEAGFFIERLPAAGMGQPHVVVNRWHRGDHPLPPGAARAIEALARSKDRGDREAAELLAVSRDADATRAAESAAMTRFTRDRSGVRLVRVPELGGDVHDVAGLRRIGGHLFES
jgi:anion-transporting  ArsA/GET3 family ATPase